MIRKCYGILCGKRRIISEDPEKCGLQEEPGEFQRNYQIFFISKQQLEISRLDVEASKDRAKVVGNKYRSGITPYLDWEKSQDGWVKAEIGLLTSIRDYQISRAKMEESMGMGLE